MFEPGLFPKFSKPSALLMTMFASELLGEVSASKSFKETDLPKIAILGVVLFTIGVFACCLGCNTGKNNTVRSVVSPALNVSQPDEAVTPQAPST